MTSITEEVVKITAEDAVSEVVISRPQSLNALNADVLAGLILAFEKLAAKDGVRVIILTGAGEKAFVAGADIHTMAPLGPRAIADYVELGQRAMRTIECASVPVIAALNGYALGGGLELALACDIIIAARSAKVGQPEVNLGIIPGFGGTQRLIHRAGIGAARRLIYTGEFISADEALRLGVIDQVVEPGELMSLARKTAETIAQKGPLAVQGAKMVLRESQETSLLAGLRLEVEKFIELFASEDRAEGMAAFMQKRPAKFQRK